MSYIISQEAHTVADDQKAVHLMFYSLPMDGAVWGPDLPNSSVMLNPQLTYL